MEYLKHEKGYLIPALEMKAQPTEELNKYGSLRREFLRENAPDLMDEMTLMGTLYSHLLEIGKSMQEQVEQTINELLKLNPNPYNKNSQPLEWTGWMNNLKAQAEEMAMPMLYAL